MTNDISIIGGCGHVGLPLALCFAREGLQVTICDVNEAAVAAVSAGDMPFLEEGGEELLREQLAAGRLRVTTSPDMISCSETVVLVVGTPVDRHLNPSVTEILGLVRRYLPHLRDGQLLVLRSTLYPGTADKINELLQASGLNIEVAVCPERIAQGHAIEEIYSLPQIISAYTPEGLERVRALFSRFSDHIIELTPLEAELAKLFTNSYRYIKFAIANQFYTMANDHGVDFYRLHEAITRDYPRAADLPKAGFAAGPCLLKDTMQLAAFDNNKFFLGHAAMMVNEGLPAYLVEHLRAKYPLANMTVGVLGLAFKADSDDRRDSLAYKLRRILETEAREVLVTDPFVADEAILPLEEVLERSDLLVIAAPHRAYRDVAQAGKPVVDIWNLLQKGALVE